jgi:hydroxypyruvate isomerase
MPRFCANLTWLYPEHAFADRFAAAARDGFTAVEMNAPYEQPAAEIASRLHAHGLVAALINTPAGDAARGERGLASLPGREDDFRRSLDRALEYTRVLGNERLHVLAGVVAPGADRARHRDTYRSNLAYAAGEARTLGVTLLIEPINPRDMPGYFLNLQADAHAVCHDVGAPNVKVQMDLYHCQVQEGGLAEKIREHIAGIAHFQVAGVPGRHEPDVGEVDYPYLFALIDELGYEGWIGCEYRPLKRTSEGLGWARKWLGVARG